MGERSVSKKQQQKIIKTVKELDSLNKSFKEQEERYKAEKDRLQNIIKEYTDKSELEEFDFDDESSHYKVRPIINRKITWDIDKLSEKLDKGILNEVIDKEYTINDFDSLIRYLKSCGVDPKKFKKFIDVKKSVNNKKIDELSQLGDISAEDIIGCYELQANFSYVKISLQELQES
mgnify:CR=1 FL=1